MTNIANDIIHVFVMIMILGFGIVCLVAGSGSFDHWNSRLKRRVRRRQRIIG